MQLKSIFLVFIVFPFFLKSQESLEKITVISDSLRQASLSDANDTTGGHKAMLACAIAANDNFANATLLTVNGASVSGSTCGTLEGGETTSCNTGIGGTVWYKFVASATTMYVKIAKTAGSCFFGSAVYSSSAIPTSACKDNALSCQQDAAGPAIQIYQLPNLTIGNTYYIQVMYNPGGLCGTNATFDIAVTNANPGGYITNPAPLNTCAAPAAGCYFNAPPTVAAVQAACTGYSLNASSYSANAVWSGYFQFTNSPSFNTAQIQAIIQSNCGLGNVNWFDWTIYSSGCGLITCGDLSNLSIAGLACGGTYNLFYQIELANCTSFTAIWPYQNAPGGSPACTPLPIELLFFTAKPAANGVLLDWQTVNEINSKEFIIEKSADAINYQGLTVVKSSRAPSKYSFTDESINTEKVIYYKLKHIDQDKTESYSKVVSIVLNKGHELIKLSPNPSQNNFDIGFTSAYMNMPVVVEMYDLTGKKVLSKEIIVDFKVKQIETSELPKGLYIVNILTGNPDLDITKTKFVKD